MRAVNELLRHAFDRNSFDDRGAPMRTGIHFRRGFANAFWVDDSMIVGDGDGRMFNRFTVGPEMFGHSFGHGVIQHTRPLAATAQAGAMGESLSDIFGVLTRQWTLQQRAVDADWLIGVGLLASSVRGVALRSMRAPGTAYDDPILGRDPQPAHMRGYVDTADDNGGVHINSGILNHAFYLAAIALGGNSWEALGRIWYTTLTQRLTSDAEFDDFARATVDIAGELYGNGGRVQRIVADAWSSVGLKTPVFNVPRLPHTRPVDRPAAHRPLRKWRRRPAH